VRSRCTRELGASSGPTLDLQEAPVIRTANGSATITQQILVGLKTLCEGVAAR
jgi:hypothetical protein